MGNITKASQVTKALLLKLKKNPVAVLNGLSDDEIAIIIQKANYDYYQTQTPAMSDDLFDIIKETLEQRNPGHPVLRAVGAAVKGDKVKLPYYMGSLDKIKTENENELHKFRSHYTCSYMVSAKLDGNSALWYNKDGAVKLYTRGNGIEGQDISHLVPFIKHVPSIDAAGVAKAVRGELIMSKKDFASVSDRGANARNMVAGIINAKTPDLYLAQKVQFIAYEMIEPSKTPEVQMSLLEDCGFKPVSHRLISEDTLTMENLSKILKVARDTNEFECDGIVVAHNSIHKRKSGENPKYAFAFKNIHTMDKAEVVVLGVEWNISKDGYFKPTVLIQPVNLAGVTVKRATGFNGKFIYENKIGPGSRVILMRSGDVIPHIVEVLSGAEAGPQMPEEKYVWGKTGVDIMVDLEVPVAKAAPVAAPEPKKIMRATTKKAVAAAAAAAAEKKQGVVTLPVLPPAMAKKNLVHFFEKIEVDGVSGKTIEKLYDAGYTTAKHIFDMKVEDYLTIPGFKQRMSEKVYQAIQKAREDMNCLTVISGSNVLGRGFGVRKVKMILKEIPTIATKKYIPTLEEMLGIHGVEEKTAAAFIEKLPLVFAFLEQNGLTAVLKKCAVEISEEENGNSPAHGAAEDAKMDCKGYVVIFTGVRDADLEKYIIKCGAEVKTTMSKKITHVIAKDPKGKLSGKIKEAMANNIPVLSLDDFKRLVKYM